MKCPEYRGGVILGVDILSSKLATSRRDEDLGMAAVLQVCRAVIEVIELDSSAHSLVQAVVKLLVSKQPAIYSGTPKCGHPKIRTPLVYWTLRLVPIQYKHVLFHP